MVEKWDLYISYTHKLHDKINIPDGDKYKKRKKNKKVNKKRK